MQPAILLQLTQVAQGCELLGAGALERFERRSACSRSADGTERHRFEQPIDPLSQFGSGRLQQSLPQGRMRSSAQSDKSLLAFSRTANSLASSSVINRAIRSENLPGVDAAIVRNCLPRNCRLLRTAINMRNASNAF